MAASTPARTTYTPVERTDVYTTTAIPPIKARRISWGSILAGTVVALITMFALYMLGLALGAATVDPLYEVNPVEPALGTGAIIWSLASTLIGLFLGGFTAGRMSGIANDADGVLHGLVTWAVVSALTLLLLTTSIGGLISGVTNAFTTVTAGVAEAAPEVVSAVAEQDGLMAAIQNETRSMFTTTTPATTEGENGSSVMTAPQADAPMTLDQFELNREIAAFLATDPTTVTDADRDALAASIAERTGANQAEVREQITRWEATALEVRQEAEEAARQAGQVAADLTTLLAGAIFAMMIAGAFAAGAGGYYGTENYKDEMGLGDDHATHVVN
ncbi:MAG: hypothetical protein MUF38_05905 [Anaerolineae bacterium]|jgi:hypothetical protein|nr:hypothetical protein [Anaerolineae bacterium]